MKPRYSLSIRLYSIMSFVVVGLPYSCPELADISEVKGGSPLGAGTIAGADGSRMPSDKEIAMARFQGKHVAEIAAKLSA